MKVQTCLENLEFFAYHGMYDFEKLKGGKFRVDIILTEKKSSDVLMEKLSDIIDYEQVLKIVKAEMENPRDFIETVAQSIINQLKTDYNHLENICVKITKYNPAGKFDGGNASVVLSLK